jgi:hypothetical protein
MTWIHKEKEIYFVLMKFPNGFQHVGLNILGVIESTTLLIIFIKAQSSKPNPIMFKIHIDPEG